jgi:predicted site-specific integrase-resolvase
VPEMTRRAYTRKQFCDAYGIGKTMFFQLVRSGQLKVRKPSVRKTLVEAEEAERWLQSTVDNLDNKTHMIGK